MKLICFLHGVQSTILIPDHTPHPVPPKRSVALVVYFLHCGPAPPHSGTAMDCSPAEPIDQVEESPTSKAVGNGVLQRNNNRAIDDHMPYLEWRWYVLTSA
jgi:hypothetical protein